MLRFLSVVAVWAAVLFMLYVGITEQQCADLRSGRLTNQSLLGTGLNSQSCTGPWYIRL